jgi:ABC-type transport system involved in multi-copper enzyme maturation permease subunit
MPVHIGLGPVFAFEWLITARRWQLYAARAGLIGALLVGLFVIWWANAPSGAGTSVRAHAQLGEKYFYALVGIELALVMLAAPAATAGAICVDRARGLLAHILVTDITDSELVLGKLANRLFPVFALVACSWPVMALGSLLGGIDPTALMLALGVIVVVGILGCTLALTISVWARKVHEVVLLTYVFWIANLLAYPLWLALTFSGKLPAPPKCVLLANPFYLAFGTYIEPGRITALHFLVYYAIGLAAALVLLVLAIFRIRRVSTREVVRRVRHTFLTRPIFALQWLGRRIPGPPLDANPVLWREWHRARPSRLMAILVYSLAVITTVPALWEAFHVLTSGWGTTMPRFGAIAMMLQVILGFLMLAAVAPMSLSEERQRGSLDVLLATPLSTRSIVLGKWLGTFRFVPLLLVCPAIFTLALAKCDITTWVATMPVTIRSMYDQIPLSKRLSIALLLCFTLFAHGAATVSTGIVLATWVKRQGRAVATGVGLFIMVAAVWPIFLNTMVRWQNGRDSLPARLCLLSPIYSAGNILDTLLMRMRDQYKELPAVMWWDIFVLIFAVAALEFTVRTFNNRFDRMPTGVSGQHGVVAKPTVSTELVWQS